MWITLSTVSTIYTVVQMNVDNYVDNYVDNFFLTKLGRRYDNRF